jgi:tetratricopeptide (TPR) repeat protein
MLGRRATWGLQPIILWKKRVMRVSLLILSFLATLMPSTAFADVIYLKNGRTIRGQVTQEDSRQVTYSIQGGELSVPTSMVDHIEKSADSIEKQPADESQTHAQKSREIPLPSSPPGETSPGTDSLVIKDGAVDEAYLLHLDSELTHNSSPENTRLFKQAYQQAALFQARQGDPDGAIQKYQQALKLLPNDLSLTLALGYLQVTQNHYLEAADLLLPTADRYPKSADVPMLLGSAYYGMENMDEAIAQWNKALAIKDNPRIREAITKAEREREISGSYRELRSEHFLLRYEGEQGENLSGEVLSSLEESFQDLVLDLDYSPREVIVVLLYPNQAFKDITRSPSWVGAINDGKIRVPLSGLTQVNVELARVLKHELTHSFIRQITVGRCPTWFNEGLAQLEEGATTAAMGSQLARAVATGSLPSFPSLEGPFLNMPQDQAVLVYAKSLAALEYLRNTFDMAEIRSLLKAMPSQPDFAVLLQVELRLSYAAFEQEVANYIVRKYGT